jgi:ankyrin repeat protein
MGNAAHAARMSLSMRQASLNGDVNAVRSLVAQGENADSRDRAGNTALGLAAASGDLATVRVLLNDGADVNARNEHGVTPLEYAVNAGNVAVVQALLDHGADPNIKDDRGRTVLISAAAEGQAAMIAPLVQGGADVEARDNLGRTPLICAAMRENHPHTAFRTRSTGRPVAADTVATVVALIQAGEDVLVKDAAGRTAMGWAGVYRNTEIVPILATAEAKMVAQLPQRRVAAWEEGQE